MIDNNLPMSPTAGSLIDVYDQNFNRLGTTIELFNKQFEDERITRSKGKEVLNFSALSTSNIYPHLQTENIVEFGGRWFRIKYAEDDSSTKGLTHYDCYALWYELAEGTPTPLKEVGSTIGDVANVILKPFGKWVELVIPDGLKNRSVNSISLQENSALYKLRYLAKRFNLEITFGYREVIEHELRYVKTVVFLQQYAESKIDFPLVVEENLKHIARTEDSRNLVTAYKISGKSENDEEEFTFADINGGSAYLVDTSWFTSRGMRPRIIPKAKKDDRYTIKQNMLDAARSYLDIYAKPLVSYEASAILYEEIPNLHHSQLVIDDTYSIVEWRKVSSRKLNYDDLTASIIVFDDPRQDLMDLLNDDGDGALSPNEESDFRPVIRYANDAKGNGFNDKSGAYIGVLVTKKNADELGPQDFSWQKMRGDDGLQGPQGAPGRDGVDGIAGKAGKGIVETQVTYYLSTSGTTKPQTGWTEDVPPLVKGRYLWTRTIWRYSDGQLETGYSVSYIGQDGNSGKDGIAGKDGVGIKSTAITYASHTSGTSAPSTGWQSQVPTVAPGNYLWTRTVWHYSDNTTETGYSVSKIGEAGPKGSDGRNGLDSSSNIAAVFTQGFSTSFVTVNQGVGNIIPLGDGWAHYAYTNNGSHESRVEFYVPKPDGLTENQYYTFLAEIRNNQSSMSGNLYHVMEPASAFFGNGTAQENGSVPIQNGVTRNFRKVTLTSGKTLAQTTELVRVNIVVAPGKSINFDMRMSVYVGKYEGDYLPFSGGRNGSRGTDGLPGKDGVGIRSISTSYGLSANETTRPQSFTATIPTLVKGQFLWTRNLYTYTDGKTEEVLQKTYIARDGNNGSNGIAGKDGVGIRSTDITYGQSNSGTTYPQTWTKAIPNIPDGQFLWTRTIWTYTDNTQETGYSVAKMGERGSKGDTGTSVHVLKTNYQYTQSQLSTYSASGYTGKFVTTSSLSKVKQGDIVHLEVFNTDRQGKAWIVGTVISTETNLVNVASSGMFESGARGERGSKGEPGEKGADGKTSYHHWAYSSKPDGTDLTLTDKGQQYMGYYTDFTEKDSSDKTKYKWTDRWAHIEIGTNNLLKNSLFESPSATSQTFTVEGKTYTNRIVPKWSNLYNSGISNPTTSFHALINSDFSSSGNVIEYNESNGSRNWKGFYQTIKWEELIDGNYVFSADVYGTLPGTKLFGGFYYKNSSGSLAFHSGQFSIPINSSGKWERVSGRLGLSFQNVDFSMNPLFYIYGYGFSSNAILYMKAPMLNVGTVPAPHSKNFSEIEEIIQSKADNALTEQQLRLLTEKAQQMQAELEAKAAMENLSDLERKYNAYVKANDDARAKSENDLIEAARRVDQIVETIGGLKKTKTFIDTYLTESNEGVIIGTQDGNSTIKISHNRISMHSAGKEVMYISQGVIHIDNGVFTKSLQIGRFVTSQHETNLDMNICRYIG